eukprot:jgi/Chlat1/3552/Chrsp234S03589
MAAGSEMGNAVDLWEYLLSHLRSEERARTVRENLRLHGLLQDDPHEQLLKEKADALAELQDARLEADRAQAELRQQVDDLNTERCQVDAEEAELRDVEQQLVLLNAQDRRCSMLLMEFNNRQAQLQGMLDSVQSRASMDEEACRGEVGRACTVLQERLRNSEVDCASLLLIDTVKELTAACGPEQFVRALTDAAEDQARHLYQLGVAQPQLHQLIDASGTSIEQALMQMQSAHAAQFAATEQLWNQAAALRLQVEAQDAAAARESVQSNQHTAADEDLAQALATLTVLREEQARLSQLRNEGLAVKAKLEQCLQVIQAADAAQQQADARLQQLVYTNAQLVESWVTRSAMCQQEAHVLLAPIQDSIRHQASALPRWAERESKELRQVPWCRVPDKGRSMLPTNQQVALALSSKASTGTQTADNTAWAQVLEAADGLVGPAYSAEKLLMAVAECHEACEDRNQQIKIARQELLEEAAQKADADSRLVRLSSVLQSLDEAAARTLLPKLQAAQKEATDAWAASQQLQAVIEDWWSQPGSLVRHEGLTGSDWLARIRQLRAALL